MRWSPGNAPPPPLDDLISRRRAVRRPAAAVVLAFALLAASASQAAAQTVGGVPGGDPSQEDGLPSLDVTDGLLPDSLGGDGLQQADGDAFAADAEVVYANLGSQLSALAVASAESSPAVGSGGVGGDAQSGGGNSTSDAEPLLLTMELDANRDGVLEFLDDNGVTAANVVGDYVEAYVPPALLAPLAQQTGVSRVREMPPSSKDRGAVTPSRALRAHGASAWHLNGFTGDGVKVGVIDGSRTVTSKDGFTGLRALLGSDLPSTVVGRCYTGVGKPTANLANCDAAGGDDHGTMVAESLMDMAPDADLYVSNPRSYADFHKSVVWMHSQGVKVIVQSATWSFHGAADGTSPFSPSPLNTVKWAADNGITWVNSAGNRAQSTWYGAWADSDGDGYHEWAGQGSTADEAQMFLLSSSSRVYVNMRWDDSWGGAAKDLDLVVSYSSTRGGARTVVGSSADVQNGGAAHYPWEGMWLPVSRSGYYWVQVKKKSASAAPSWVQFMSWSDIEHYSAGGHIGSPADSPSVLAVGAVNRKSSVDPTLVVASYSSRGPTPDGRTKPDVVASHCERTITDGYYSCGTSQSAPFVAGLAALVLERYPAYTPAQVADYLESNGVDRGATGADNTWGHGLALLPSGGLRTIDEICATTALTGSGAVQGTWDSHCLQEGSDDTSARYYSFALAQQTSVTIELTTTADITTRLQLRRGGDARGGTTLEPRQTSGTRDTAARITIDLPAGDYTINAAAFHSNERGPFTLKVAGVPTLVASGSEVAIAADSDITEGSGAAFTVSASPPPSAPLTVWVKVDQQGAFGVTTGLQPVTVSTSGSGSLTVATVGDSADEADGSVTATVDPSPRYSVSSSAGSASVTVADDEDSLPLPVAGDNCVKALTGDGSFEAEWASACLEHFNGSPNPWDHKARYYTFTLAGEATVTISLSTLGTSNKLLLRRGSGEKDNTFSWTDDTDGCIVCPQTRTSQISATLPAGDYTIQASPYFPSGAGSFVLTVAGISAAPTTTPEVSVSSDGDVTEGAAAAFTLSASPAPTADLAVAVTVADSGDFAASGQTGSRTVTIGAGQASATLSVSTTDDSDDEADGSITATLDAAAADAGYTVSATAGSASAAVADDDDTPAGYVVDAGVVARVKALAGQIQHGSAHVNRWQRVLVAFGEHDGTGVTGGAMTAAQAQQMADTHSSPVWDEVVAELTKLEAVGAVPEVSVTSDGDVAEGTAASFTVSASPAPAADLTVTVTVADSGDFAASGQAGSRQVTIGAGQESATLSVSTVDDSADESDSSITATLDAPASDGGYTVSATAGSASAAVADNDVPQLSIAGGSGVTEGGTASFTITASPAPASPITVKVSVSESGSFGASGAATVAVSAASTTYTVTTTDDSADEADGSVTATLKDGSGYTVSSANGAASVTVADDDDPPVVLPVVSVTSDGDVTEGSAAVFTVSATTVGKWPGVLGLVLPVSVTVSTSGDYGVTAGSKSLSISRLAGSVKLSVPTTGDGGDEADGSVTVRVDASSAYTVSSSAGSASAAVADDDDPPAGYVVDAGVVARVRDLAGQIQHGSAHVNRWNRVLVAFGEHDGTGVTGGAMTAAQAQQMADRHSSPVWDEVVAELTALEAAGSPPLPELSIAAGGGITEGGTASFTITASPAPSSPITVKVGVIQSGSFGASGAATVTVSGATTTYTIATTDDQADEADGSVTATLQDGSGYTVSATQGAATVAVADNDDPPVVTPVVSIAAGAGVTEGGTATFTITASPAPSSPITVKIGVSESGSFGASGASTVTVSGASTTYTVSTADDQTDEADGSVTATLQGGSGYTVSATQGAATVTVADNDDPPVVTPVVSIAAGGGITEGGTASFTITASPAPASPITVKIGVSESGSFGASGAATVTVSGASATYTVTTTDDQTDEADGSVTATLQGGSGYTVSATQGAATVTVADNDDPPVVTPVVSIAAGAGVTEGGTATFTITASPAPASPITVKMAVSESGSFGASGAATVTVSGASATYTVSTTDDSTDEADGSVTATLEDGSGYTVSATQGAATVTVADNDDAPPQTPQLSVTVEAASAAEGEALVFKVVLSRASSEQVTVVWRTETAWDVAGDRARRSDDYEDVYSQLVFAPGVTELTGEVWLEADGEAEGDEHFAVEAFLPGSWFRPDAVGIMTITDND